MDRMRTVKDHFENEASSYDDIIIKLIPYYREMMEALATALPFCGNTPVRILDLGCGTGTLSSVVRSRYPKARFTLVDISEKMLGLAEYKVGEDSVENLVNGDFSSMEFTGEYDGIISSLALHHLESDSEKKDFFAGMFQALKPGGVFINADVVLASSEILQKAYMQKWIEYMKRGMGEEEIKAEWLPKYYREDRPAPLSRQLIWLSEAGFDPVETIWKYYNFAVYGGEKR